MMAFGGLGEALLLMLGGAVAVAVVANVIAALIGIWPARRRSRIGVKILAASFLGSLATFVVGFAILWRAPTHESYALLA
jgi:hypothetical protein